MCVCVVMQDSCIPCTGSRPNYMGMDILLCAGSGDEIFSVNGSSTDENVTYLILYIWDPRNWQIYFKLYSKLRYRYTLSGMQYIILHYMTNKWYGMWLILVFSRVKINFYRRQRHQWSLYNAPPDDSWQKLIVFCVREIFWTNLKFFLLDFLKITLFQSS